MCIFLYANITDCEIPNNICCLWYVHLGRDIVLTIAANKLDLESNRQVLKETVLQYASTIGAPVFSTSAKTNKGIEQCFIEIARQILKRQISQNRSTNRNGGDKANRQVRSSLTISAEPPPSDPQKSSCC